MYMPTFILVWTIYFIRVKRVMAFLTWNCGMNTEITGNVERMN